MKKLFAGISTVVVAVVVLIVIVVAAASAFYLLPSGKSTSTSSTANTTASSTVASVSSTSTQSSSSSSSAPSGELIIEFDSPTLIISSDLSSINYSMNFHALGNVPPSLSLGVIAPSGFTASVFPVNLTLASSNTANLQISASQSLPPGNYQFALTATGQGQTYTQNESVQVVKYLVVTIGATYVPKNLTVTAGSTVTWFRLNGVLSQYDNGDHNVVFSTGTSGVSPTLQQYATWPYTFTQVGNYSYYCKFHPFMTGEITVTSS